MNERNSRPIRKCNGTFTRTDNRPCPDFYQLKHTQTHTPPLFYMDDSAFVTETRRGLIIALERSSLYLAFHNVHMHPTKTLYTWRPPKTVSATRPPPRPPPPAVLSHGEWKHIREVDPSQSVKYLGIHFNANNTCHKQHQQLLSVARTLTKTLASRNTSLVEARYLIDTTVHASIGYRTAVVPLPPAHLDHLDRICIQALKRSARLPATAPAWQWPAAPAAGGAEYRSLYQKTFDSQLMLLSLWLADPNQGPLHHAIIARLTAHGLQYGLPTSPILLPPNARPPPHPLPKKCISLTFCEALYHHCHRYGTHIHFHEPPRLPARHTFGVDPPAALSEQLIWSHTPEHLKTDKYGRYAKSLNLLYLPDLLIPGTRKFT